MMKNKTAKVVINGVVLAAIAAIGVAAFQLGTSSKEEIVPQELIYENEETEQKAQIPEDEELLVDAGTSQVEASMDEDDSTVGMETEEEKQDGVTEDTSGSDAADSSTEESSEGEAANTSAGVQAAPALNFSEDTLTEWPVNGNILLDYNMEQTTYFPTLDQYKLSPAIALQAAEGTPVAAAAEGMVYSIEETSQTGTTVTMELGNGYQAIYGQLTNLMVSEGDTVEKGTIIGYVNAPTKYYSKEGSNLYFAMKRNGTPVDPILYLP